MMAPHLTRRLLVLGAASLALSACGSNLIGPPEPGPIYTVRPSFTPASGDKVGWALTILSTDVPGSLETDRIALMQPDGSMDYYAKATYPSPLSSIVQQSVLEGFEASGRIDAVAKEQDALHSDYDLVLEVRDFEAKYSQPDAVPSVMVAINAKLATAHGRKIIASFTSSHTVNASANSAAAAAQALQQALQAAVLEIVTWTFANAPAIAPGQEPQNASPGKPAKQLLDEATRGSDRAKAKAPQ
jgi:cholesterol transport system auxiliary component